MQVRERREIGDGRMEGAAKVRRASRRSSHRRDEPPALKESATEPAFMEAAHPTEPRP